MMKITRKRNVCTRGMALLTAAALFAFVALAALTVAVFTLPSPAAAQETPTETETPPAGETQTQTQTPTQPQTPSPSSQEEAQTPTPFYPAFRNLDVVKLNENQMALLMINNQIEYLMLQIQDKDKQISTLNAGFDERLQAARREQATLQTAHAEKIKEMEERVKAREADLEASRQELHSLEMRVAAFLGDSGLYLVALIAAIVGLILGLILSAVMNWRRNKGEVPQKAKKSET